MTPDHFALAFVLFFLLFVVLVAVVRHTRTSFAYAYSFTLPHIYSFPLTAFEYALARLVGLITMPHDERCVASNSNQQQYKI